MKKSLIISTAIIALILVLARFDTAFGRGNQNSQKEQAQIKVELKSENGKTEYKEEREENGSKVKLEVKNKVEIKNEEKAKWENYSQVKIKKGKFDIKGKITAVSPTEITLNGIVINIDSSETKELKIVGDLEVGKYAMAKGKVVDEKYYAEKVVVNNRDKGENVNVEEDEEVEVSVTPSISPTPTATETTELKNDEIEIKAYGKLSMQQLIDVLQRLIDSLTATLAASS